MLLFCAAVLPAAVYWGKAGFSECATSPVWTRYVACRRSPALKLPSSLTAGTPAFARHELNRSSHGPLATGTVTRWLFEGAEKAGRIPIARIPKIETVSRRRPGEFRTDASTDLELDATVSTTADRPAILPQTGARRSDAGSNIRLKIGRLYVSGEGAPATFPRRSVKSCLLVNSRRYRLKYGIGGGGRLRMGWRTGWDLNPRQPCGCTAFPVPRLRPDSATRPAPPEVYRRTC